MIQADVPGNESQRLEALHQLGLLDSAPEKRFDQIVDMAKEIFDVPVALISLIDEDRQWFKSKVGMKEKETPRNISFCAHALAGERPVVVENAAKDRRFYDNPLVTGDFALRFYAGHPIHSPEGYILGSLCILDHVPRQFSDKDLKTLRFLAKLVDKEIEAGVVNGTNTRPVRTNRFGEWLNRLGSTLSRKPIAIALSVCVFFVSCIMASVYYTHALETDYYEAQSKLSSRLFTFRARLETELNTRLHLTQGLAGLVRAGPEQINGDTFQSFANDLGNSLTAIRSLQLAPAGVVKYVWPEDTNSPAIGHNLLADPSRLETARKAIDSGELWIAGPLTLIQGGTALIGRLPVFLPLGDQQPSASPESFWGFATVLIDLDSLLKEADFEQLAKDLRVAIRGRNGLGSDGEVFMGSEQVFAGQYLSASVALPAGSWEIGVSIPPLPTARDIPMQAWATLTLVSLVLAAILYVLMRLPYRFVKAVDAAKRALAASNAQFKDAIESLPDGIAVFDVKDRLVRCNHKFREFFDQEAAPILMGCSFRELLQTRIQADVYAMDGEVAPEEFFARRIAHHRDPTPQGMELKLTSGIWLHAVESRIPSGGTVIAYTDVSELKRKEQELKSEKRNAETANEAKTAFLATVSHELRTPLNAILGFVNLIRMSGRLQTEEQEYIELTHESAEHLLNLLNELLDLSKMEAGKLELESNTFNLATLVKKSLKLCSTKAEQKHIALIEDIDPAADTTVAGDAGRLQQILLNLVSNGIKFTDLGSVTVTVSREGLSAQTPRYCFSIQDTGVGFNEDQAKTLFQPFRQLDSTASRKHEGTGLGLAICKRLVELMGGEISAQGAPDEGALFQFTIPLESVRLPDDQEARQTEEEELPRHRDHGPVRVLIAEDSPANQLVFRAMLEGTGYYVDIVGNGLEALNSAARFNYDIILMDIFMPEMNGIEASQAIRKAGYMASKPIIALTANAMSGDREKFLAAGMDDYLPKPASKAGLIKMLNKWT